MNRFFKRSTIGLICLATLGTGMTACDETSGNPSGQPEGPSKDSVNLKFETPTSNWTEQWLDHTKDLSLVYYNEDVVIYYDSEMPRTTTWNYGFMTRVWQYVKTVYGDFGKENRLYVVCHAAEDHIGRTGNIFDKATTYRSLSDVTGNADDWTEQSYWALDAQVHEVGHVVEGSSHGVHESPAFDIWRDSKWAEIFQYDVYMGIGRTEDADRLYTQYMDVKESFPAPDTYWFRDWFFPIYDDHGKSEVLNKFLELLSQHFPKENDSYNGKKLNMGEFVHFWSGAAETDLTDLATDAFGWTPEWQAELDKAKADFPGIVY